MQNIRPLHGTHITGWKRCNGNRFSFTSYKFHFKGFAAFINMHNRADIAALEMVAF